MSEIAKEIIKNSIRSAICIDDNYSSPYHENPGNLNATEPKKLYYSFRESGHCDLDIYHFINLEESWKDYMIHNKDLMILDWELDQVGKKFRSTLKILQETLSVKKIPFIVIYTATPDLNSVSKTLLENYNYFNIKDYNELIKNLKEKFKNLSEDTDEIEEFLEEKEQLFYEFIHNYDRRDRISHDIINKFTDVLSIDKKIKSKVSKKIVSTFSENNISNLQDALLIMSNIVLGRNKSIEDIQFETERIEIKDNCYLINGVVVLTLHKKDDDNGVDPEDLFDVFSEAISSNPHSIINLLSLELKDKFREDFSVIGTNFNKVSETALKYHAKNYEITNKRETFFDKTSFQNFIKQSWINELHQYNLDLELKSFQILEQELKNSAIDESSPNLHPDLTEYASMVSCVTLEKRMNKKLSFGDLFISDNEYFLCITPLCDCLRPDKIDHEFFFIKGESTKLVSALQQAEQGFYSFVKEGEEYKAVKWLCKPFTCFVPPKKNNIDKITCIFSGKEHQLSHVTILKENYAQRIANHSFGYGHRIGVDFPHLRKH